MRKHAFTAVLAAVVAATCITLTGCTGDPGIVYGDLKQDTKTDFDWQIHFNRESGKITAIFDHKNPERESYRSAAFDEKEDLALPFNWWEIDPYSGGNLLEGVFSLDSKDYPTSVEIFWSFGAMNEKQQAIYYNQYIASPESVASLSVEESTEPSQPAAFSLHTALLDFLEEGVMSSSLPTPRFGTSGKATVLLGPDFLVDGYVNNVPAKDLVDRLTGAPASPNGEYDYVLDCATYEIALLNKDELDTWINQLPFNKGGIQIQYNAHETIAKIPTAAPCDISVRDPLTTPTLENPGTYVEDPLSGTATESGTSQNG